MPDINILVENKIATKTDDAEYICDNSDYVVKFSFDAEWDEHGTKTARFIYNDRHEDVIFTGDQCAVPKISNTYFFNIGVFAGDLHTTTPARVPCKLSVLCGAGAPADPTQDVYNQILAKLNELGGVSPDDVAQAVADYMTDNPIKETDPTVPEWAKSPKKPKYTAEEVGALSADDLLPLTGTTTELTPSQAQDAVLAGRPVVVQYTDSEYGVLKFTNFNLAPSNNLIASVAIIKLMDLWVVYALYGYTSNQQWKTGVTQMATGSDMNGIETSVDAVSARVATLEGAGYLTLDTLPKYGGESV